MFSQSHRGTLISLFFAEFSRTTSICVRSRTQELWDQRCPPEPTCHSRKVLWGPLLYSPLHGAEQLLHFFKCLLSKLFSVPIWFLCWSVWSWATPRQAVFIFSLSLLFPGLSWSPKAAPGLGNTWPEATPPSGIGHRSVEQEKLALSFVKCKLLRVN